MCGCILNNIAGPIAFYEVHTFDYNPISIDVNLDGFIAQFTAKYNPSAKGS